MATNGARTELTVAAFDARLAHAGFVLSPGEREAVLELGRRLHNAAALVRANLAARTSPRETSTTKSAT